MVLIAVGVGSFFAGRASVSTAPAPVPVHLELAGFEPLSATFGAGVTQWVLGVAPCAATRCVALLVSSDGGATWRSTPLPGVLVAAARRVDGREAIGPGYDALSVRFANAKDGWIFGSLPWTNDAPRAELWSTHDGGDAWTSESPGWVGPQGTIFDVEAARGTAYLIAPNASYRVTMARTPVGEDQWRKVPTPTLDEPAGGGEPTGSIVLRGTAGWMVEGNDRGTTGSLRLSSDGTWAAWTPPCAAVGDSFTVPQAASTEDLATLCTMGGFASSLSKSAPPGATLGSTWLYFSTNGGATFAAGPELGGAGAPVGPLLADASDGALFVELEEPTPSLAASFDGGEHWTRVAVGQAQSVSFATGRAGVAVVQQSSGRTVLLETHDGGRTWTTARF